MSRRAFIESHGATCRNWTWSWSFVNARDRVVIFGAWDKHTEGNRSLILDEAWATRYDGRRNPGFFESREHIRLVEDEGYELRTFPIEFSSARQDVDGRGPAVIKGFTPVLTGKALVRVGTMWYASDGAISVSLPEELPEGVVYTEGASRTIAINAFERNSAARTACIQHHGAICAVCAFEFETFYGAIGRGMIHAHHVVPLAEVQGEYVLNPITDLIPVCPNCHAVIHMTRPALTVEQLREHVAASRSA